MTAPLLVAVEHRNAPWRIGLDQDHSPLVGCFKHHVVVDGKDPNHKPTACVVTCRLVGGSKEQIPNRVENVFGELDGLQESLLRDPN